MIVTLGVYSDQRHPNELSSWKIRRQTGHVSDAMLSRYIRDGEIWWTTRRERFYSPARCSLLPL